MSLENNISLNIYSIAIILIIYFHGLKYFEKSSGSLSDKLYRLILNITVIMLVIDIFSRFDGKANLVFPVLNHIGNFLIFLLNPILPSLWVAYVHYHIYHDEKNIKRLLYPLGAINLINVATLILSQFFGWFYYIDSDNVYHRGPCFWFPAAITIMLMLAAFVIIVINRRKLGRKSFFSLIFFAIPPSIGIILQIIFFGTSLVLNGVVLSLLVVFLNIQNISMNTDYLTGVNNRKKLDAYLKEKISMATRQKTFSAILFDINNFKCINDTYGHNIGDIALETAAKLLKSCLRSSDFIARYGGDEFCVVLDISNKKDLEALVYKINNCLERYNESDSHEYKLEFSMGYAVYDYKSRKSAEEFLQHVDKLMYQNKLANKNKYDQSEK